MKFLQKLIGCTHQHLSWPITSTKNVNGLPIRGTTRTCTDCGAEYWFDVETWRTLQRAA